MKNRDRVGYKLIRPLICFDCNLLRKRMAEPVFDIVKNPIGHRCVKCTQKRYVTGRPKGRGWRNAFNEFIANFKKSRKQSDLQKTV